MKSKYLKYSFFQLIIGMGVIVLLVSGCKEEEEPVPVILEKPAITTISPLNVIQITAQCGGIITSDGNSPISASGVVWSTNASPTIDLGTKTVNGITKAGTFISEINGLTPDTKYYVRAYATNDIGTTYGSEVNFTTMAPGDGLVSDINGNVYQTVMIGTQSWLVENLKTTKFNDGTAIPSVTDNSAWGLLTTSAYCNDNNSVTGVPTFGRLYNWYAVNDAKKICPAGWHVPTDAECTTLESYIGGLIGGAAKLKESGNFHWTGANTFATNEFKFNALPGNYRPSGGVWVFALYKSGYFWTNTQATAANAYYRLVPYYGKDITRTSTSKKAGYSVRCVKDN